MRNEVLAAMRQAELALLRSTPFPSGDALMAAMAEGVIAYYTDRLAAAVEEIVREAIEHLDNCTIGDEDLRDRLCALFLPRPPPGGPER